MRRTYRHLTLIAAMGPLLVTVALLCLLCLSAPAQSAHQLVKQRLENPPPPPPVLRAAGLAAAAPRPRSLGFLFPLGNPADDGREFDRLYTTLGYDVVFISDHYGLRQTDDANVERWLRRRLQLASEYEARAQKTPLIILDVEGFRLATNRAIRALAEASPYVWAYHVFDEPDAHLTGKVDEWARTPEQLSATCRGTIGEKFSRPLVVTFENQAGLVRNRAHNYRLNDDALYLRYMAAVAQWSTEPCLFGIDYYLFNRSTTPPTDQRTIAEMMTYFGWLVYRAGPRHVPFAWTEPVLQGLGYICDYPGSKVRPATPAELRAQVWLYWATGQRGLRGDFSYIFRHLCGSAETWNPYGLEHPHYALHRAAILEANAVQQTISDLLDQVNVPLLTSRPEVVAGLRFRAQGDRLRVVIVLVNHSSTWSGDVVLGLHPILHQLGAFGLVYGSSSEALRFADHGFAVQKVDPLQVSIFEVTL